MAKRWIYADLARVAKKHGGPVKYIETIKKHSFQQGLQQGEGKLATKMLVAFTSGVVVSQIPKVVKYCRGKVKKITDQEAKEAEEKLIEVIREVDNEEIQTVIEGEQEIRLNDESDTFDVNDDKV